VKRLRIVFLLYLNIVLFVAPNPYRSLQLGVSLAAAGFFARLTVTGMFEVDKKERLEELNKTLVMRDIAHLAPQASH